MALDTKIFSYWFWSVYSNFRIKNPCLFHNRRHSSFIQRWYLLHFTSSTMFGLLPKKIIKLRWHRTSGFIMHSAIQLLPLNWNRVTSLFMPTIFICKYLQPSSLYLFHYLCFRFRFTSGQALLLLKFKGSELLLWFGNYGSRKISGQRDCWCGSLG